MQDAEQSVDLNSVHFCSRNWRYTTVGKYLHDALLFSTEIDVFTTRAYVRAVLGVVILSVRPSFRLSGCLSYAWIVTNLNGALQIFWYHTKGQSFCYSDTNSGWWATLPSFWNLRSKWPTPLRKTPTSTDFCL